MASGPVERVLASLRGMELAPRRTGNGWESSCPSHVDSTPSLSISEGDDGRVLMNCHAGCPTPDIVEVLGLTMADLFTQPQAEVAMKRSVSLAADPVKKARKPPATTYPDSDAAARAHRQAPPRSPDQTWDYTDANGKLVGRIARWDMPNGGKVVLPALPLESGGWATKGMPVPRPLYRLPEVLGSPRSEIVYVVEGEKCADAAAACGMLATTGSHGSGSAEKTDWEPLRGRDVVVLPDADEAGEKWAGMLSGLLTAAGARRVRVVHLSAVWPDIPKSGDIADYLAECGGDAGQTLAGVQQAIERCSDGEDVGDGKDDGDAGDAEDDGDGADGEDGISEPPQHSQLMELVDRCCQALESFLAESESEDRLRAVFRVARVLCDDGSRADSEVVGSVAKALAIRNPQLWAMGYEEAELELKQAVDRYEPSKDRLVSAVRWARSVPDGSTPACLSGVSSSVAQLVFLTSLDLARCGGGLDFWVSGRELAEVMGDCTQPMVSQSFNHYLIPAGLVELTRRGHTGRANDYRLFADAEAIMGGAMPGEGEQVQAASDSPSPNVLPDEGDDIPF